MEKWLVSNSNTEVDPIFLIKPDSPVLPTIYTLNVLKKEIDQF